jgi:hypothetical protein
VHESVHGTLATSGNAGSAVAIEAIPDMVLRCGIGRF